MRVWYAHTRTPASVAGIAVVAGGPVAAGDVSPVPSALLRRVTHTRARKAVFDSVSIWTFVPVKPVK